MGIKRQTRVFLTLAVVGGVTALFGHACSRPGTQLIDLSSFSNSSSSSGTSSIGDPTGKAGAEDVVPIAGQRTASLVYSKQILDNMVSCSGVGKAGFNALSVWEKKKGSISEYGYATAVTAPMLMSAVSVAGEVCSQLLDDEMKLDSAARRVFKDINFSQPLTMVTNTARDGVIRRLARSCWQRNETVDERDMILREVDSIASTDQGQQPVRNTMLMICTGMLASLSSLEM